jgi:ParB family chromosome partitioning protein
MAGSGMAKYIYDRRHEWMGEHTYDFTLGLFDLTPQTPDIQQHNLLESFPVGETDYIFIDLPYLGMSRDAFSDKPEDMANMDETQYLRAIQQIAMHCASAQATGKLCTVVSPNYADYQRTRMINMSEYIRESWHAAGYRLYMETYASRRIQQAQNATMARMNNVAKERRLPLTDIVLVMTFERGTGE